MRCLALLLSLTSVTASAGEPLFPRSQYGSVDLRMPQSTISLESILGANPNYELIADYAPEDRIRQLARPVGRLDILLSAGGVSTCTASLLPGGYAITNHHCVPGDGANGVVMEASLLMGYLVEGIPTGTERFMIETKPVETNADLDYSIVRIVGVDPSVRWGSIRIDPRDPRPGESLVVVHHPAGLPQHVTRGGCRADAPTPVQGVDLRHRCDTFGGSSGSPIFSDGSGSVIGLHYAGSAVPGLGTINLAKRMSAIVAGSPLLTRILGAAPRPAEPAAVVVVPPRPTTDVVAAIRALPSPGSEPWDESVRGVLVAAFDQNGTATLDQPGELAGVGCAGWKVIDELVRQRWPAGLYQTYGFALGDDAWLGGALGIDPSLELAAAAVLDRCGLAAVAEARLSDPRALLVGLPPEAGWDRSAARVLVTSFDHDHSGAVDTEAEVAKLSCEVWGALEAKVQAIHHEPLSVIYGFDQGYVWMGYALGFGEGARQAGMSALRGCRVIQPSAPSAAGPVAVVEAILRVPAASDSWTAEVQRLLVMAFDRTGSGDLDQRGELDLVDCRVWRALDTTVRQQWQGTGVAWLYGFEPDAIWLGSTLGFDTSLRAPALAAIERCGLRR